MNKKSTAENNKKRMSIDDLAVMVQRGFTETATKDDLKDLATKKELLELKDDLEVAMGQYLGTFRKDYDELARRVRKLEEKILFSR